MRPLRHVLAALLRFNVELLTAFAAIVFCLVAFVTGPDSKSLNVVLPTPAQYAWVFYYLTGAALIAVCTLIRTPARPFRWLVGEQVGLYLGAGGAAYFGGAVFHSNGWHSPAGPAFIGFAAGLVFLALNRSRQAREWAQMFASSEVVSND